VQESIHQAATILLLREKREQGRSRLEVYMTKRPDTMRFLPGHYVFPGGQMDDGDADPAWQEHCLPIDPSRNPERLSLSYWITALRETFEEAGLLIARRPDGSFIEPAAVAPYRQALLAGECTFLELVQRTGVILATDRLRYFGHRLTPRAVSRKRFDTRYFLTPLPPGFHPEPHAGEVAADDWIDPIQALKGWESGRMPMVPPTRDSLRVLARFHTLEDIMQSSEGVGNPTPEELE
jgi:8-oxo-dGTP pyrophosphatase MutT (NUDIX family)